jgi:hypothetical protein
MLAPTHLLAPHHAHVANIDVILPDSQPGGFLFSVLGEYSMGERLTFPFALFSSGFLQAMLAVAKRLGLGENRPLK